MVRQPRPEEESFDCDPQSQTERPAEFGYLRIDPARMQDSPLLDYFPDDSDDEETQEYLRKDLEADPAAPHRRDTWAAAAR